MHNYGLSESQAFHINIHQDIRRKSKDKLLHCKEVSRWEQQFIGRSTHTISVFMYVLIIQLLV